MRFLLWVTRWTQAVCWSWMRSTETFAILFCQAFSLCFLAKKWTRILISSVYPLILSNSLCGSVTLQSCALILNEDWMVSNAKQFYGSRSRVQSKLNFWKRAAKLFLIRRVCRQSASLLLCPDQKRQAAFEILFEEIFSCAFEKGRKEKKKKGGETKSGTFSIWNE